jgi:excisionase family DNA binding protein
MSVMTVDVPEASRRLGVSARRVRELIVAGVLPATRIAGRYAIVEDALDELAERSRPSWVRAFSRRIAWGAAALVDGEHPGWLSQPELSRLRRRLSETDPNADAWRTRLKERAGSTTTYRVTPANTRRLLSSKVIARSGVSARNLASDRQVAADMAAVWQAQRADLAEVITRYAMLPSDQGNVVVRIADVEGMAATGVSGDAYRLIVAADLLDAGDARQKRAGRQLLHAALGEHRWVTTRPRQQ